MATRTGIDFSFSRVPATTAKAAGYAFAISYLTDQDSTIGHAVKQWRPEEIAAYRAAGLGVVAVWQGGEADRTTAWRGGYDRGRRDALRAVAEARRLGRPPGRPIYFAVDSDTTWDACAAYVDGARSVLPRAEIGVYGGRRVVEGAMASGAAAWFWQTGAWSGGVVVPGVHLYQRVPPTRLGPYDIDVDEALQADYGAWFTHETTADDTPDDTADDTADDTRTGRPAMRLIPRAEWGARPYRTPGGATPYAGTPRGVKIHYLGTPYADRPHERCAAYVRDLQASHMDGNGWSDIGYSFLVCTHGFVYEGRGLRRRNSANGNTALNEAHYAVCGLVGDSGVTEPTTAQLHGLRDAIEYCRDEGPAGSEIRGHRDGYNTDCPGDALYAWVLAGAPRPGTDATEDDDMLFTDRLPGTHALTAADAEAAGDPGLDGYVPVVADALLAGVRAELNSKALRRRLDEIAARIGAPVPVQVDAAALAAALAADRGFVTALASALADEQARRSPA